MKVLENGKYRDMTDKELSELEKNSQPIPYKERVIEQIRQKYSIDDELAILRQRDTKPEEFAEYNAFVEEIKATQRKEDVYV